MLATTCNVEQLTDSLVRDRIVCGMCDDNLRENLLKVANSDLDKCIEACRATELTKEKRTFVAERIDVTLRMAPIIMHVINRGC
ncbi:Hypothetical predicted protein, partial [Paramuricea clavata]